MKSGGGGGEGEGREHFDRTPQADPRHRDNVIRLPRDWLGPRDELVPFGPSAGPEQSKLENEVAGRPSADEGRPALPVSPADFWGEHAAALHDAVEEGDEAVARRFVLRLGAALRLEKLRRPTVAVGLAVAVAIVVVGYVSLPGQSGSHGRSNVASRQNPSRSGVSSPWSSRRSAMTPRQPIRRPANSFRSSQRANAARPAHGSHSAQPPSSATSSPVVYAASASGSTTAPSTYTNPPSSPVPSTSSSAPATTGVGTRHKSSTLPFGAHGALGPGSSPTH